MKQYVLNFKVTSETIYDDYVADLEANRVVWRYGYKNRIIVKYQNGGEIAVKFTESDIIVESNGDNLMTVKFAVSAIDRIGFDSGRIHIGKEGVFEMVSDFVQYGEYYGK